MATDQESLISHFGITKAPWNPQNYIKKPRKAKQTIFICRIWGPDISVGSFCFQECSMMLKQFLLHHGWEALYFIIVRMISYWSWRFPGMFASAALFKRTFPKRTVFQKCWLRKYPVLSGFGMLWGGEVPWIENSKQFSNVSMPSIQSKI